MAILTDTHLIFNINELEEEEDEDNELQQIIDTTFAEQLQLEEALNASLLTSQMSDLQKGNCPVLNCHSFKQFQPQDLIFLWEKAPKTSSDPIPYSNCRAESHAKMNSKSTKRMIIPRREYNKANTNSLSNKKGPKQVYKCVKSMPPFVTSSSPRREDEWTAFAAPDSSNSDQWPDTDDYDLNTSPRSPETCRKSKWLKNFDRLLEFLSNKGDMNNPDRQWHCPACRESPHAFKQYAGLQDLTRHANRERSTQLRLHQELAQLLQERSERELVQFIIDCLNSEAASTTRPAKPCPKWKGLKADKRDHEIVWPPMVVISYATHKMDENKKWIGMTNQEVMNMFSSYDAIVKAQQCYNVEGHCGKSVLVFESSVMGYLEAERLHKHFIDEGTDRNAWNSQPVYVQSSGEKQLYGYLALKEDVDIFNRTSVKHKLKYEMRSYEEVVVNGIKIMCKDNDELVGLRNRVAEQEKQAKECEQSYGMLKEKLQIAKKELEVMRNKVKEQHQQHMEEVECQEQFYKEQIRNIVESRKENDGDLERAQDEENDHEYIREDNTKPIKNEDKGRSNARRMLANIVRERVRIGVL